MSASPHDVVRGITTRGVCTCVPSSLRTLPSNDSSGGNCAVPRRRWVCCCGCWAVLGSCWGQVRAAGRTAPLNGGAAAKRNVHNGRHLLGAGMPITDVMGRQSLRLFVICAVPCVVMCNACVHVQSDVDRAKKVNAGATCSDRPRKPC
jgi:hypothetical protein